jgi:hypothetical protein
MEIKMKLVVTPGSVQDTREVPAAGASIASGLLYC